MEKQIGEPTYMHTCTHAPHMYAPHTHAHTCILLMESLATTIASDAAAISTACESLQYTSPTPKMDFLKGVKGFNCATI